LLLETLPGRVDEVHQPLGASPNAPDSTIKDTQNMFSAQSNQDAATGSPARLHRGMVVKVHSLNVFRGQESEAPDRRENSKVAVTESSFDGTQTTLCGTGGCV
jgi:hypothetical protein